MVDVRNKFSTKTPPRLLLRIMSNAGAPRGPFRWPCELKLLALISHAAGPAKAPSATSPCKQCANRTLEARPGITAHGRNPAVYSVVNCGSSPDFPLTVFDAGGIRCPSGDCAVLTRRHSLRPLRKTSTCWASSCALPLRTGELLFWGRPNLCAGLGNTALNCMSSCSRSVSLSSSKSLFFAEISRTCKALLVLNTNHAKPCSSARRSCTWEASLAEASLETMQLVARAGIRESSRRTACALWDAGI